MVESKKIQLTIGGKVVEVETGKYAKMLKDRVELFRDGIFHMKLICRTKITFKAKLKHLIQLFLIRPMRYFSIMFHLSFLYYENV